MNTMILALGLFSFFLGSAFLFGVSRLISLVPGQIQTFSIFIIPSFQIISSIGFFFRRTWGLQLTVFLLCFYLFLGIFILRQNISAVDFLPLATLIEYIPSSLLRVNLHFMTWICLMFIPLFMLSVLSLKQFQACFESKRVTCATPFPLVLAAGFIFSYGCLANSSLTEFITGGSRTILGIAISPLQAKGLRFLELNLPIFIAMGLVEQKRLKGWILAWIFFGYYCLPFFGMNRWEALKQFNFVFWLILWIASLGIISFYACLYWGKKVVSKNLSQEAASPKKNISILRIALVSSAVLFIIFWVLKNVFLLPPKNIPEVLAPSEISQSAEIPKPDRAVNFRLEGIFVDQHLKYAVISGKIVKIGDSMGGFLIEEIEKSRVLLSTPEERFWLSASDQTFEER